LEAEGVWAVRCGVKAAWTMKTFHSPPYA
jgi:hypothetical protein